MWGIIGKIMEQAIFLENKGYCYCCDQEVIFSSESEWLRPNYKCSNCKSIPRERALMYCIEKFFPDWRTFHIHESSPGWRPSSIKLQRECANYSPTQFYPEEPLGKAINGFINQNLEDQTFRDEILDLVITQDVMEHVFAPDKAFKEIARTLKKGGAHVFTVPLVNKGKPSERWAELDAEGNTSFFKQPQYHGNPINPKGSPVAMHWGYDITDFILKNSGLYTTIYYIDQLDFGIRAEFIEVLISRKH